MKKFDAQLVDFTDLCSTVRHFRFSVPEAFTFIPGQFVITDIMAGEKKFKRSYSIASDPIEKGILELCVKKIEGGIGTHYYFSLQKGDTITLNGPFGGFKVKDIGCAQIFVATGTGIAPFRSMIPDTLRKSAQAVYLFAGYRHEGNELYGEGFRALEKKHPNFHYTPAISQPRQGTGQRVGDALSEHSLPHADYYLCGLKAMIEDVTGLLLAKGVPRERIYFERYD